MHFSYKQRVVIARQLMVLSLTLLSAMVFASQENSADLKSGQGDTTQGTAEKDSVLDRHKRQVDAQVNSAARWVDAFFGDIEHDAEVSASQFRIRPELYYRDEQGAKFRLKASLKLSLPNIGRKISLVAGVDPEEGEFGDSVDDSDETSVIGLQFFGKKRRNWHTSLSAGIKFNEFAGFIGPRVRLHKPLNEKSAWRFTQTVRWQTNNYWQIISRVDFNHVFTDRYFFRQTIDGRWRGEKSDEEGYRTRVSSFLTQRLHKTAGLQYEFSTTFHSREDFHVDEYTLAVRYRKRTSRDWLYYEVVPQVSFEDEFNFSANPGLRLRVEFFYGGDPDTRFGKRELEDSEDFRW